MTKSEPKLKWGLILFTYLCMAAFGLFDNMTGPAIPAIISQYDVVYSLISVLMIVGTLGYLTGTIAGGIATDRVGFKPIFIIGNVLVFLTSIGLRFADRFYILIILWFLMRVGFGCYETGCNSLGAKIFIRASAVMMNLMHLFYGVGSIAGTQLMGRILAVSRSWHDGYFYAAGIAFAAFIICTFVAFPKPEPKKAQASQTQGLGYIKDILKDRVLWLLILALGFSELIELGIGSWVVNFLEKAKGFNTVDAANYLTLFFVFFTVARLLGGWIAEKIGYMRFIIYCSLLAATLFYIGFVFDGSATICFAIAGAPIAMLFPMSMTVIMTYYKEKVATIMGFVIALAGVMYMILNQMIGFAADYVSLPVSFAFVGAAGLLVSVFTWLAKIKMEKAEAEV